MGVVHEVFDRDRGMRMALKQLKSLAPDQVLRFKNEFRAVRDVSHPNLVGLGELFEDDGHWYFTMDLVDGVDVLSYVRGAAQPDPPTADTTVASTPTDVDDDETAATVAGRTGPVPKIRPVDTSEIDVERLRAVLGQLIDGLGALHRAGIVHRDIKPSNILVTPRGRVILLDFGVAGSLDDDRFNTPGEIVGTVAYMAPEQAAGELAGAAADWYAVGVLIYEALTGRLPLSGGTRDDLIERKQALAPPPPIELRDDVPADLSDLCADLLQIDPRARPDEAAIRAHLGMAAGAVRDVGDVESAEFVGRSAQLASLRDAFRDVREGRGVTTVIEGTSGVGKTRLAEHFLEEVSAADPALVVLRGRCHERELVHFKAFDGIVDDLAQFLTTIHVDDLQYVVPAGATTLLQVFPVLRKVDGIDALAARSAETSDEITDSRGEAFKALRRLLTAVAERCPLVLFVDDLHWSDADSDSMIADVFRAPSPPLLLLATARPTDDGGPCAAARVAGSDVRRIPLSGLDPNESRQLVLDLFERFPASQRGDVDAIVEDTAGHPMFIDELVRHLAVTPTDTQEIELDDAIASRVATTPEGAQAILEMVCAAGRPLPQSVIADATGLSAHAYANNVAVLHATHLVRLSGARQRDSIAPYHDRVREAVSNTVTTDRAQVIHKRLGVVLERAGAAPEVLANHFTRSGDRARAAEYTIAAAHHAATALAFDRAADLYGRALAFGVDDDDERRVLFVAWAEVLADAGRPADSARMFLEAASCGQMSDDDHYDLLRRSAERFLMGGYFDEGLAAMRKVLDVASITLPESQARVIASLVWNHARLALRGLRWKPRKAEDISAAARRRMDVCWSAGAGISMVDTMRGSMFWTRGPIECLKYGDPLRISRALFAAAVIECSLGRAKQARKLIEACERAADQDGTALSRWYATLARPAYGFLVENRWTACLEGVRVGRRLWEQAGHGQGWESDVMEQFACWSLNMLGDFRELTRRVPSKIRSAQRGGNRFLEVSLRTFFTHLHLVDDNPELAIADMEDAIGGWLPGVSQFGNAHYWVLRNRMYTALYTGNLDRDDTLEAEWDRFENGMLGRVAIMRIEMDVCRSGYLVGRAMHAHRTGDTSTRNALVRTIRKHHKRLGRARLPVAQTSHLQLTATMARVAGDDETAARLMREVLVRWREMQMQGNLASASRMLGGLLGGDEGRALVADADTWMTTAGIRDPARFAHLLAPGW
jgi:serine/threonine protein kinase